MTFGPGMETVVERFELVGVAILSLGALPPSSGARSPTHGVSGSD